MASGKRRENETFEEYKQRLRREEKVNRIIAKYGSENVKEYISSKKVKNMAK